MSDTNNTSQWVTRSLIEAREEKELRFIIIGKSGNGKSALGNSLCGAPVFKTSSSASSCTKECRVRYREFEGTNLIICDTTGLFDTNVAQANIKREICRSERMVSPGPHAFLIVLSAAQRFTEEEQRTIDCINEMFGSNAGKYCILIVTREEDILSDEKTIDQYLEEAEEPLKRLVAQCQHRYMAINNKAGEIERNEKIRQLINIVRKMLKENQAPYYTNEMFREAEKEFEGKETEALNQIKAQVEAHKQNLREEIQREIQQNLQQILPSAANDLRNMQRDAVNNQQGSNYAIALNSVAYLAQTIGDVLSTHFQNRPAIAAIEAQAVRDERRDRMIYENMQSTRQALGFSNHGHDYFVRQSGETDSDSD